jgi:hypothetical protein
VSPWHFTTWRDLLDHWQTLIAGVLALVAAFGTVAATMIIARRQIAASREEADEVIAATREQTKVTAEQTATTVRLERDRVLSEVDALRKSLAVELRLQIARAFGVYDGLRKLSSGSDGPISARMVEGKSRMPAPIIYSANAGKVGLLEGVAMDVVIVYTMLEGGRGQADRLPTYYMTPDNIDPTVVLSIADVFLDACERALRVLPKLRTGDPSYDAEDEPLTQKIEAALAARRALTA